MRFTRVGSIGICAILAMAACESAYATDTANRVHGEFGVNRRVISPYGYGGVSGTFSEPAVKGLRLRENPGDVGDIKDVPQMYFGVHSSKEEVDAGITWEKATGYTVAPGLEVDYTAHGAWCMFYRPRGVGYVSGIRNNPKVAPGNLGAVSLTFGVTGKQGVMSWSSTHSSGTFSRNLSAAVTAKMNVKRVTALTQDTPTGQLKINYNGSEMKNANFSGGKVAPLTVISGNGTLGAYGDWSAAVQSYMTKNSKSVAQAVVLFAPHYVPRGRQGASFNEKVARVIETVPARSASGGPPSDIAIFNAESVNIIVGSNTKPTAQQIRFNKNTKTQ